MKPSLQLCNQFPNFPQLSYDSATDGFNQFLLRSLGTLLRGGQGGRAFPGLAELSSYDDFFDSALTCPAQASPGVRARYLAVTRHGNLRTKTAVIVRPQRFDARDELSVDEWEILLTPLLLNTNLEELYVLGSSTVDSADVREKIYELLGEVLRLSTTLKYMFLEMEGLSSANAMFFSRAMQLNYSSILEALIIIGRPQAGVLREIEQMLGSTRGLTHLWLRRVDNLSDSVTREWCECILEGRSLEKLSFEDMNLNGIVELMLRAFNESPASPSVRKIELIRIEGTPTEWQGLLDFLRENRNIRSLEVTGSNCENSERTFVSVMEMLEENHTLTSLECDSFDSWRYDGKETQITGMLLRNVRSG